MRRGPLLGIAVFLASTVGGYKLGLNRRAERLRLQREAAERERREAEVERSRPVVEPVAISTDAVPVDLPTDVRRSGSVPRILE
jgi:hypothetical protein